MGQVCLLVCPFSLDDINLSSAQCPQPVWHICNITGLMAATPTGRKVYSPRFLSPTGYSFQVTTLEHILKPNLISHKLFAVQFTFPSSFTLFGVIPSRCLPEWSQLPSWLHGGLPPPDLRPQRSTAPVAVSVAPGNHGLAGSAV